MENSLEEKYKEQVTVRGYEVDLKHQILPNYLIWMLQEAAVNQIEDLDLGYGSLIKQQMSWALAGFELEVEKLPVWRETVDVITWHKKDQGVLSYRDFTIVNAKQEELVRATSAWFIIDLQKRRPVIMEKVFPGIPSHSDSAMDSRVRRSSIGEIPEDQEPLSTSQHKVLFSNLDHNGHANNVYYVNWMLNSMTENFLMDHVIKSFGIYFVKELNLGDIVTEKSWKVEDGFIHALYHQDGQLAAVSKSRWSER